MPPDPPKTVPPEVNLQVTPVQQITDNSCWAACALMAYEAFAGVAKRPNAGAEASENVQNPQQILAEICQKEIRETAPIVDVLKIIGIDARDDKDDYVPTFTELQEALSEGEPLILTVRPTGIDKKYNRKDKICNAHYIIVIGYNKKNNTIQVIDPRPLQNNAKTRPVDVEYPRKGSDKLSTSPSITVKEMPWHILATYYLSSEEVGMNTVVEAAAAAAAAAAGRKMRTQRQNKERNPAASKEQLKRQGEQTEAPRGTRSKKSKPSLN